MRRESLILLFLVFFLILFLLFREEFENIFYLVCENIQPGLLKIGKKVFNILSFFTKAKKLEKENDNLLLENRKLKSIILGLQRLEQENTDLKKALDLNLQEEFQLLSSKIIFINTSEDLFLINKGRNDGIIENMAVITPDKTLIGEIGEVYDNFSKVKMITNKEMNFPVLIQNREVIAGARGTGALRLLVELIPQEKKIETGDLVITNGLDGVLPTGLLVGEIKDIKKSDLSPHQQASLNLLFNLNDLDVVFTVLDY